MFQLTQLLPSVLDSTTKWDQEIVTIGRDPKNDVEIPVAKVSMRHAAIQRNRQSYVLRDLNSTNGTFVIRGDRRFLLNRNRPSCTLADGDRISLGSSETLMVFKLVQDAVSSGFDNPDQAILAEEDAQPHNLEQRLQKDERVLRCSLELARRLPEHDCVDSIARLCCELALEAFSHANRVLFLRPTEGEYRAAVALTRQGAQEETADGLSRSEQILDRCLTENKGFLFRVEKNSIQPIATQARPREEVLAAAHDSGNRVILCTPLLHRGNCHGFLEIEAPILPNQPDPLDRKDLALSTLIGYLVASRLEEIAAQANRIKLVRKATAGFLAATVGHCVKNLLCLPQSMCDMIPIFMERNDTEQANRLLARTRVAVQFLDVLSNEFASASKDPHQNFQRIMVANLLQNVARLANQVAPDRIVAKIDMPLHPISIIGQLNGLQRMLTNLTLNAIDAFFDAEQEHGEILLKASVIGEDQCVRIEVSDNGPGMSDTIRDRLMDIYNSVRSSVDALSELENIAEKVRSSKRDGFREHYGIGFVFICHTVHQHRGQLSIDSIPGEGTTITIDLPAEPQGLDEPVTMMQESTLLR